jgi:hypothetical protein
VTVPVPDLERRGPEERRAGDRRSGAERHGAAGALALVHGERRSGSERRSGRERRVPQTPAEHVRRAIDLVARVAEAGDLGEEELRALDSAIVRLRFAVTRLERP